MRDAIIREYADALKKLYASRRNHRLCPAEDRQQRDALQKQIYDDAEQVAYLKGYHAMTQEEMLRARTLIRDENK